MGRFETLGKRKLIQGKMRIETHGDGSHLSQIPTDVTHGEYTNDPLGKFPGTVGIGDPSDDKVGDSRHMSGESISKTAENSYAKSIGEFKGT